MLQCRILVVLLMAMLALSAFGPAQAATPCHAPGLTGTYQDAGDCDRFAGHQGTATGCCQELACAVTTATLAATLVIGPSQCRQAFAPLAHILRDGRDVAPDTGPPRLFA